MNIERMSASSFYLDKDPGYVDVNDTMALYSKMAFRAPLALEGPKGVGKSISIAAFARDKKIPIVSVSCSEDTRRNHLLGQFVIRGGETPFILGPIPTAFEVANEVGSCILNFEEVNALTPHVQKVLNSILDFRKRIEVAEVNKVFTLEPSAKLWVTASMNGSSYGGVYEMNEDLKSRFRILPVKYPTANVEKKILRGHLGKEAFDKLEKGLLDGILTLANETRQKAMGYALSTRDIVQLVEDYDLLGFERAFELILGKFDEHNRQTVLVRKNSIFKE